MFEDLEGAGFVRGAFRTRFPDLGVGANLEWPAFGNVASTHALLRLLFNAFLRFGHLDSPVLPWKYASYDGGMPELPYASAVSEAPRLKAPMDEHSRQGGARQ